MNARRIAAEVETPLLDRACLAVGPRRAIVVGPDFAVPVTLPRPDESLGVLLDRAVLELPREGAVS